MSEPTLVVIELTLWDASKVQALLAKIEQDDRVLSVRVMSE